ncbi:SIS domain-containing protein [Brucella tritici]|uniref:SIS domain-containing protein n=1 Tax=Brucella tritici TaxID=94626 RepID=A0A7V7VQX3_9HYPH|nr:SIS domain-containing protein [Brucella tritici]KAB2655135.1 SIS domain-containing protein [Brucella tritici]
MLNFDPEQYLSVEKGAVALADTIDQVIGREFDNGMRNIAFWGVGGVAFLNMPAVRMLQTMSPFPTIADMGAEVVLTDNVNVGPGTLIVFTSVSGTTKEAVAALDFAKKKGARVLTLCGTDDTPLAKLADVSLFNKCADPTSSENYYLQTLFIALSIIRRTTEYPPYERVISELKTLPELLVGVKQQFESRAADFAAEIKDEQHHIITGAGNSWYEAWYYAMCILEEMQWIWTRPIHASDFFHGTLELLEADTSVWILKGEDSTRPLAERVEKFATTVTKKVRVFDSRDFALPGLSDDVRALVSPIVFAAAFERLSTHLEKVRDHDLTTRRYYKKGNF